jgi:hypothetical protein
MHEDHLDSGALLQEDSKTQNNTTFALDAKWLQRKKSLNCVCSHALRLFC